MTEEGRGRGFCFVAQTPSPEGRRPWTVYLFRDGRLLVAGRLKTKSGALRCAIRLNDGETR